MDSFEEKALSYHSSGKPGKVTVVPSKPCKSAEDLSLAYTPGVAKAVLKIADNPQDAYRCKSQLKRDRNSQLKRNNLKVVN